MESTAKPFPARPSRLPVLISAIAGAVVFQFYGNDTRGYIATDSLFRWWSHQWVNPESETQHGLVVLALGAWLLWRNLRRSASGGAGWSGPALAGMAGGLAVHALGFVAEQARISILGLLLFTWGACALGGGARWGRAAAFPLAFLVFAIPMNALDTAGFWLRVWVVDASTALAHAAGIGVVRNGTQLLAPDGSYDYDVAAACSGVRSLTALAALSLLTGYVRFRPWAIRLGFLALSVPLVLVGNIARIAAIIFAAQAGGRVWGDRAHAVMGYGVFAIVLGGVFGAAEMIGRRRPEWEDDPWKGRPGGSEAGARVAASAGHQLAFLRPGWIAGIVVALAAAECGFLAHVAGRTDQGRAGVLLASDGRNPAELPTFLGTDWIGGQTEVTAAEREILPPDTGFSRKIYVSVADRSQRVLLSIVLSGRDRTSIHRPELCLVGQGWTIGGAFEHRFRTPGVGGADFPATVLRVRRETPTVRGRVAIPQLVAYWFMSGDAVVATQWERMKLDAWNRVAHGRADRWAYVLLQTGSADGEPAALSRMQAILDGTLASFRAPASGH